MILDGRNRHRACVKLAIESMTRPWDGKGDPLDYVISKNLHRRHLNESQRAMVADKIATLKKGTNQHTSIEVPSQDKAAKLMNVGISSVQRARVVRTQGSAALQQAVEAFHTAIGIDRCPISTL